MEELKALILMFPIEATGIVFAAVNAQTSTMFVEQGMLMNTTIGSSPFLLLSTFDKQSISAIITPMVNKVPQVVDRAFKSTSQHANQSCSLWELACSFSMLSMTAVALVEIKRLQACEIELGLSGEAVALPVSIFFDKFPNICWLVLQKFLDSLAA
ncbi:PROTEIN NRT1/ PTR FAMILY 8.3 [Salix purpurea]|uniref:PROTEIN NRT1/ PTR FAMILY 8.3 n=1 Tax=Salix purpurea TaxID=77065 RepID=A0A9Q0W917_SALPP|nr:PROTEIN NRT1/ PTR FAMILY 8.3 [Salix purpurea]